MRIVISVLIAGLTLAGCHAQPAAHQRNTAAAAEQNVNLVDEDGTTKPLGAPPAMGDPSKNPDMVAFAREVDTDGDGHMSRAEWQAQGLPSSSFNMFEKGRGYVTLHDYQVNAAPAGIDLNGDGKLTVSEFKTFDQQMSSRLPPPR